MVHYCLQGECEWGCDGLESQALANAQEGAVLCIGRSPMPPLMYRWKGVERALAYVLRATRFYGLIQDVVKKYKQQERQERKRQQQQEGQEGEEQSFAERQLMRARATLDFFNADVGGHTFEKIAVATKPVQKYMNQAFSVDMCARAFSDLASTKGATSEDAKAEKMLQGNLAFITGEKGIALLIDYGHLFRDFGEAWKPLTLERHDKFKTVLALAVTVSEVWFRLVQPFCLDTKYEFMALARYPPDAPEFLQGLAHLRELKQRCEHCVDDAFTTSILKWLPEVPSREKLLQIHTFLVDIVRALRVTSVSCERKHLLGNDLKGKKPAGRHATHIHTRPCRTRLHASKRTMRAGL